MFATLNDVPACEGSLSIGGIALTAQPSWTTTDLSPLYAFTSEKRGGDIPIPGIDDLGRPRVRNSTRLLLPFLVVGKYDRLGALQANPNMGLIANAEYLNANLVYAAGDATTGLLPAVWTRPDATTKEADVHVLSIRGTRKPGALVVAVLEINVPSGRFS